MSDRRNIRNPRRRRRKPKIQFDEKQVRKLAFVAWAMVLVLIGLCVRIAQINIVNGNEYSIQVLSQQGFTSRTIPYKRGDIQDRNGNVLATSVMVYNLVVDSKVILSNKNYLEPTVNALSTYFDLSKGELEDGIRKHKDNSYWVLFKDLTYDQISEYEDYIEGKFAKTDEEKEAVGNTKGVWFEKKYKRMYPNNSLACNVLGFSNADNSAYNGIEASYADYLKGTDGREYGYMDSDSTGMEDTIMDAQNGKTVVSSIDMNIQRIVQKAIKKYMKKYQPKRIAVVVSDPNTGEIYAMGDDKMFNLNKPYSLKGYYSKAEVAAMSQKKQSEKLNEIWNNYCITDSFEPGSTFKPFTVAAALEEGKINKKTTFYCDGYQNVGGFKIKCHDTSGHGVISVKKAVAESCNDALMHIGFRLGRSKTVEYQTRFGFGRKTGIDLPNETRGLVYEEKDMGSSTLATNSFGQNLTVNMIQMVAGFSSLINGGYYYEPHVVKQILNEDGDLVKNFSKTLVKETCTKDTTTYVKQCLREVVLTGTGSTAAIPGYTVGGKTGTAEKVNTSGKGKGRLKDQYILSFIGAVPCENPKVLCYTLMDSPKENTQATAFNTELWTYIMKQVLPYLGVEKTEKIEKKAKKKSLAQEFYSDGIIEGDDGSLVLKNKKN